jgi:hypothetical protein
MGTPGRTRAFIPETWFSEAFAIRAQSIPDWHLKIGLGDNAPSISVSQPKMFME